MHCIRSVIITQRYTSLFLHLIENDSFDWAIRLLRNKGSEIANAQNEKKDEGDGESALMLATELKPVSKAVELIDALMYAGASMDTKENRHYGRVFFFACSRGVDPAIFDRLIMWDSMRENKLQEWWSHCDVNGNGSFVLACESWNIILAEHILSLAFTQHRQENFLESMPNHILKSLAVHDYFNEKFMVKWLRLLRTYVDKIPQEYTIPAGKNGIKGDPTHQHLPHNRCVITLSDYFKFALMNGMYFFMEEYAALFNADYKYKETIWRWLHVVENRRFSMVNLV
jgi:hypothetical protein